MVRLPGYQAAQDWLFRALTELERFVLLSTFTVTNTNSSGVGSFAQAVADANNAGGGQINFSIGGGGPQTIPTSGVNITTPIFINGASQPNPNSAAYPLIELQGTGDQSGVGVLLNTGSNGSIVSGLFISNFYFGIEIVSAGNTIGGTTPTARNVLSDNDRGIEIYGAAATGNVVEGNYLGTDRTGTTALANGFGIVVDGAASNNRIGGTTPGARNVISGNYYGVCLSSVGATGNVVEGNYIGTDSAGTTAVANTVIGVVLQYGASNNLIGGTTTGAGNVISGNGNNVYIVAAGTTGNQVVGNLIGLSADGTSVVETGPSYVGVYIGEAASGNTVGGTTAAARNVIAGSIHGVQLNGTGVVNNIVQGNYIGTDITGSHALGTEVGVLIHGGASNNAIGGTAFATGNLISGNGFGVNITDVGSSNNTIEGNFIGTDVSGVLPLPNEHIGVQIQNGATGNIVGGTTTGSRNLISGNGTRGVQLHGAGTTGNLVAGNFIGVDATGTRLLANSDMGIVIAAGASGNTIGGTTASARNVINGSIYGVEVYGVGADNNVVQGNYIGSDVSGTLALGNTCGVLIGGGAQNNLVGGTTPGARNLITGNGDYAVILTVSGTTGNAVQGNFIGTDLTGTARLGTLQYGVVVGQGASNNSIGGTAAGAGNVIAFTVNSAVLIGANTSDLTIGNAVLGNSIFQAGGLGIDHANDGLKPNTPGGPHSGPNQLQNKPILTSAKSTSTTTFVEGALDSTPNATFRIEFFANPSSSPLGNGQGKTYLGFANVTTDANGLASFQVSLPASSGVVSATATDADGNTSEFAQALPVKLVPQQPILRSAILKWDGTVTLTWDDVAGETGYRVERSANDDGVWTVLGTVGAGATTLTDAGPITAPLYAYRLYAISADGDSEASVPLRVSTISPAPVGLTATPASNDRINLAWTDIASDEQGFKIERSTDGVTFTEIGTTNANVTSYSATGLAAGATYLFRVRAYKGNGNSAFSNVATATTTAVIPSPPTGLTLSSTSPGWINLSWRVNSDNDQGFKIERSADGVTFIQVGTTGAGATNYNDVTSNPGGTYFYRVRAYNGAGDSNFTETVSGSSLIFNTMLVLLPATSISSTQLVLSWRDFQNNETGFEVERSTDGVIFDKIATAPGGFFNDGSYLSYTVTGLSAGTTYQFRVRATNDQGKSDYSNTITARTSSVPPAVPAAPLSVIATPTSSTQIYLTWIDNADNEQGYRIERSTDGVNFTPPITVIQNSTSYYDTNLSPATTYYYRIRAYNAAGESNNTAPVSATTINLNAPTSLSATVLSSSRIELSWYDSSTNETGFKVERSTDGVNFTDVEIDPAIPFLGVPVKYQVAGLSAGTTYYFRVRAYNGAGDSAFSKVVMARTSTAPAAPTNLTATPAGNERVNLAWTDNATNEQGFKVDWSTDGVNFTPKATLLGLNQTSYSVTGLAPGTTYSFRVRAYNGDDSLYSNTATAQTTSRLPAAPTGLTATVPSNIQINLVWLAASDDAAGYHVERSTDGINFIPVPSVTGPSTSVTGLSPATTYTFRVRAYNAAGESVGFAAVVATTAAYPIAPTGVTAAAISGSAIRLSWQDVGNETGYRIERSGPSGWSLVGTVGADVTTFTDTGLSEVTNYQYRILAYNAAGNSPYSGTIYATTSVTAPANATATFGSGHRIEITWTDSSAVELKYFVDQSLDGSTGWTKVGELNANTTSLTVNGPFNPSTTYYFRIRAYHGHYGYSLEAATATVTTPAFPLAPTGVAVAPAADGGLTVTWSDLANETGYRIERSPNGSNGWTSATVGAGVTSFTDSGLAENTRYYYRVIASNAAGESVPSVTANALTLLATPGNLTVTYVSPTRIDVTWADRSALESIYAIEQWFESLNRWQQVGTTDANATSFSVTGPFQSSTAYTFRVGATSYSTFTSSLFTTPVTVTTPAFPLAPTGVSAVGSSESTITLNWTDRADETGYRIELSPDGTSGWSPLATVGPNVTTYVHSSLTEHSRSYYRVVAYNASGDSAPSATVNAFTLLATPANVAATFDSGSRIDVAWTDRSTAESSYFIERSPDGVNWQPADSVAVNTTSYSAIGPFNASTTYYFRVRAYLAIQGTPYYSAYSTAAAVTTPAFPNAPTGVTAVGSSADSITVNWSDVTNENGYRIERSANGATDWSPLGTVAAGVTNFSDAGLPENTRYYYRVVAVNPAGDSPYSGSATALSPLAAPTIVSMTSVSGNRIDLTWTDHSAAESGYSIQRSLNGTTGWQPAGTAPANTTSLSVPGPFNPSTTYYFRIWATATTGATSTYASSSVTTLAFPAAPSGLTATPTSDTAINVSWSNVTNEDGYRLERSLDGTAWTTVPTTLNADVTSFADSGLQESKRYYYRVIAFNTFGDSATSVATNAWTLPTAPDGLSANLVSASRLDLAWTDRSNTESGFRIEMTTNTSGPWTSLGTVNPNISTYSVVRPFDGSTTYYFRVSAYNSFGGASSYTTASFITPAFPNAPANLTATPTSDTEINMSWTNVANEDGYRLERSLDNSTWVPLATLAPDVTSFADSGLQESKRYYYRVIAFNAIGDSAYSAASNVLTLPKAPENLSATVVSATRVDLAWTDRSSTESGYRIELATNADGPWTQLATVLPNVTTYSATRSFDGSATYYFRVSSYFGSTSAHANITVTTPAFPNAPSGPTVTPTSSGSMRITWSDVTNATTYRLERSLDSIAWTTVTSVVSDMTTFTDTGLLESRRYYYRVTASNAVADSAPSAVTSGITFPSAPTAVSATAVSGSRIDLSWVDNSVGESSYVVAWSTNANGPWTTLATVSANTTTYSAAGRFDGATEYWFRVYAVGAGGNSDSSSVSSTTPAWPSTPRNLVVTIVSPTSNALSWSASPGATSYTIERSPIGSNSWTTCGTVDGGTTSFTDTQATNGDAYTYLVRATNDDGDSAASSASYPHSSRGWRPQSGFSAKELAANDDLSTQQQAELGFSIVFGGHSYSKVWVNNNGNITFSSALGTYTPFDITTSTLPIIASFFADVDTRASGGTVTYGTDEVDGHAAFGVNWNYVGYYSQHRDLTNSFQLVLIDRSDIAPGAFQIEFNYDQIEWETGDASGGSGGFNGTSARAGFSDGTGPDGSWELEGSGEHGGFLDSNAETGLTTHSLRSDVPGSYIFVLVPETIRSSSTIKAQAGQPFDGVVASFNDPAHPNAGPSHYAAIIDWGDGSISAGTVVSTGNIFTVEGSHTYAETGLYPVRVAITADNSEMDLEIASTAHVTDPQLSLSNPGSQSNVEGDVISLQVFASSAGGWLYYTASGLPAGLVIDTSTGLISGTISPGTAQGGPYTVELTVVNEGSLESTTFTWNVSLPAGGPTVSVFSSDDRSPEDPAGLSDGQGDVGFTIYRDSGQDDLKVYFTLSGAAVLGVDYDVSFGTANGYVDTATGHGYVTIPAGSAAAAVVIQALVGGSDDDKEVVLNLIGSNNAFGNLSAIQMTNGDDTAMTAKATVRKIHGTVTGQVKFNGIQFVRFAQVDVYQSFPGGSERKIGTTYTDATGNFTFTGDFSKNGTGVSLYVYTLSDPNQNMNVINVWSNYRTHYVAFTQAWTPTTANTSLTVPPSMITAGDDHGKAFWVYDAAITAALFEAEIPGLAKGRVGVDYPAMSAGTSYTYVLGVLHIVASDYSNSATVMHEYGHSVAQRNHFFTDRLIPELYLNHSLGYDMRARWGWSDDLPKFAFSEAWGNFFSSAARSFAGATNVDYGGFPADANGSRGETDEIAIMQLLWDLADAKDSEDPVQLSYGGETGFKALGKLVKEKRVRDIDELWQALLSTTTDVSTRLDFGKVFAMHGMAANSLGMQIGGTANNAWTTGNSIPEFTWTIPTGKNYGTRVAGPLFNEFQITVYDYDPFSDTFAEIYDSNGPLSQTNGRLTIQGNQGSWIPDQQAWNTIKNSGNPFKMFVIKSLDKNWVDLPDGPPLDVRTGPYWSDGFLFTVTP